MRQIRRLLIHGWATSSEDFPCGSGQGAEQEADIQLVGSPLHVSLSSAFCLILLTRRQQRHRALWKQLAWQIHPDCSQISA